MYADIPTLASARAAAPMTPGRPDGPDAPAAPIARVLAWCLHVLTFGLLALTAARAAFDSGPRATATIAVAVACAAVYAAGALLPARGRRAHEPARAGGRERIRGDSDTSARAGVPEPEPGGIGTPTAGHLPGKPPRAGERAREGDGLRAEAGRRALGDGRAAAVWWPVAVGAAWFALLALSAEAVWVAFPLYFLELHLLPRRAGPLAVVGTALVAGGGFAAHQHHFSVAMAIGPALGAAVAVAVVWGYQALYRESEHRRQLIEELTATRADLAAAQHTAGMLAERERLAREIHDTLAQGLSSIQLLLRAAERSLPDAPQDAARYVDQARQAAVDDLAEARRFVVALAPPALDGTTLAGALERLCATTSARHRITARFRLIGAPVPLPTAHEVALLRITQSALANTVRHAHATSAEVRLGYTGSRVTVGVTDDGIGFDPAGLSAVAVEGGGFGLAAMRARLRDLGGTLTVTSTPGDGTALTARLPLPDPATTDPGSVPGEVPQAAPAFAPEAAPEPAPANRADPVPEAPDAVPQQGAVARPRPRSTPVTRPRHAPRTEVRP